MWEQVKRAMVESVRVVRGSVRVGGGNPKSVWWNDLVKITVRRKDNAWKEVLGARDEDERKGVWKSTWGKREKLKGAFIMVRRKTKNSLEGR